jgi:hypothetical protein
MHTVAPFPVVECALRDPPAAAGAYSLHSFVPCVGARPNVDGLFGVFRCRGAFADRVDAAAAAKALVMDHDSSHFVMSGPVGAYLPLADNNGAAISCGANRLDGLRRAIVHTVSKNVAQQKAIETRELTASKARESALLDGSAVEFEKTDPVEAFTMLRSKHSQTLQLIRQLTDSINSNAQAMAACVAEQTAMQEAHPGAHARYMEKFMAALKSSNMDPNSSPLIGAMRNMLPSFPLDFQVPTSPAQ